MFTFFILYFFELTFIYLSIFLFPTMAAMGHYTYVNAIKR